MGVAPPVTGDDGWQAEFDLQGKLLGEAGRRKRVGEEMGLVLGLGGGGGLGSHCDVVVKGAEEGRGVCVCCY